MYITIYSSIAIYVVYFVACLLTEVVTVCFSLTISESSSVGLGGSGHVFDTLALEIEQLLAKVWRK